MKVIELRRYIVPGFLSGPLFYGTLCSGVNTALCPAALLSIKPLSPKKDWSIHKSRLTYFVISVILEVRLEHIWIMSSYRALMVFFLDSISLWCNLLLQQHLTFSSYATDRLRLGSLRHTVSGFIKQPRLWSYQRYHCNSIASNLLFVCGLPVAARIICSLHA